MKRCMMTYAGYKHLSCDSNNHTHRLLNLSTKQVEIWECTHGDPIGIPYKNTYLKFKDIE